MTPNQNNKSAAEQVSDWELTREMLKFFGGRRAFQVFGWAALLGAALRDGEGLDAARERLIRGGMPRSTVYDAVQDVRRFKEHLAEYVAWREDAFVRKLSALHLASE